MSKAVRKNIFMLLSVLPLLLIAMGIRCLTEAGILPNCANLLRSMIHICLLATWGISIHTRIIQTQIRRYLLAIIILMILWVMLKTVKHVISDNDIKRFLWYLYYIPMLFIPLLALFVSMSLGKTEYYRLALWTKLLYAPSALLFFLVLTNDLHQLVFSFPSGIRTDLDYCYEAGYFVILGWVLLCALFAFVIMLRQCRITHVKNFLYLPLLPLILSFAYTAAYIRGIRLVLLLAGDMTVVHCIFIYGIFESCLQCGLILSNIGYEELLWATRIPVQITDTDFNTLYCSKAMPESLPSDKLQKMTENTIRLSNAMLLKRHPLRRGWVFWKEDIAELDRLQKELEMTRDERKDTGDLLAAEHEQRKRRLRLAEENRLYDLMETQTAKQITILKDLLADLQKTEDLSCARRLLGQIIVIGTYIKRRNNLIFVGVQRGVISAQELRLCLNESAENLNLYGIKCRIRLNGESSLSMYQATQAYDLFEAVIETGLSSLKALLVSIDAGDTIELNICASASAKLESAGAHFPGTTWEQDEDGLQCFSRTIRRSEEENG